MHRFLSLLPWILACALPATAQPQTVQVPGTDYRKADVTYFYASLGSSGSGVGGAAYVDLLRVPVGPLAILAGLGAGITLTGSQANESPFTGEANVRAGFDLPVNPNTLMGLYGGYATAGYTDHYAIGPLVQARVHSGLWRGEARAIVGMGNTEAPYHLQLDARRVVPIDISLAGELQVGLKLVLVDGSVMVGLSFVGTD